jgi:hypothetical protein
LFIKLKWNIIIIIIIIMLYKAIKQISRKFTIMSSVRIEVLKAIVMG